MMYDAILKAIVDNNINEVQNILDRYENKIEPILNNLKCYYLFYKTKSKDMIIVLLNYFLKHNTYDIFYILTSIINCAIKYGVDIKMIKQLVDSGGNINSTDVHHVLPLMQAIISKRSVSYIKHILSIGADVNMICDFKKNTVLHLAVSDCCDNIDVEVIKLLLDHGADVNAKNSYGETPIMIAALTANEDILFKLIDGGSDIIESEKCTSTSILVRALSKKIRSKTLINKLIINGATLNDFVYYLYTPLQTILKNNYDVDFVIELINHGADVNKTLWDAKSPLLMAIELEKSNDIIFILIENGADINFFDDDKGYSVYFNDHDFYGITPLTYAIKYNNKEIVFKLIDSGADINAKDKNDLTPFHYAVMFNCDNDIMKVLIDNGANISNINESQHQIWYNIQVIEKYNIDEKIAKLIINRNNVNMTNHNKETFLTFSMKLKINKNIIFDIIESGADVNKIDIKSGLTPLFYAISKNYDSDIIIKLIESGADVNFCDSKHSVTPLIAASRCVNYKEVIKILVSYEANINACDNNGRTLLSHILERLNDKELVVYLIEKGAVINTIDNKKFTPTMYAITCKNPNVEIINILIENGADVNTVNGDGNTILFLAYLNVAFNCENIFELFSENSTTNISTIMNFIESKALKHFRLNLKSGSVKTLIELLCCENVSQFFNINRTIFLKFYHNLVLYFMHEELALLLMYDHIYFWYKDLQYMNTVLCNVEHFNLIDILIRFGADINYSDQENKTPLIHAISNKLSREYIDMFYSDFVLYDLLNKRHSKCIRKILEFGGSTKFLDDNLNTPLHFAFLDKVIDTIILYGDVDVAAVNIYNEMPVEKFSFKLDQHKRHNYYIQSVERAFTKHLVLISFDGLNNDRSFNIHTEFINDCKSELEKMKINNIVNSITFYKFCHKLSKKDKKILNANSDSLFKNNNDFKNIIENFPLYSSFILMNINKLKFHLNKKKLINNFDKIFIMNNVDKFYDPLESKVKNCDTKNMDQLLKNIYLNFDILCCISKYLSHTSIVNLFIASFN